MKDKKVINWGVPVGMWEPSRLLLGSVISVFNWISKYTTWISNNNSTFMPSIGSWCVIIHLSIIHVIYNVLLKSDVSGHSKAYSSLSFNLQASDWVHCEEETGAYYQYIGLPIIFFFFFKLFILRKKNMRFSKNSQKFIFHFFSKRDNWAYVYM